MNRPFLSRLNLSGYKTIAQCDLALGAMNLLIGANGAGKSNLLGFFDLARNLVAGKLNYHVSKNGGPDAFLHFGRKTTAVLRAELVFANAHSYRFALEAGADNQMLVVEEERDGSRQGFQPVPSCEAKEGLARGSSGEQNLLQEAMSNWRVYHFNDTGPTSPIKQFCPFNDNLFLRQDASNLAAFLYLLKSNYPQSYRDIVETVRLAAPFFHDFCLRTNPYNRDLIELEWTQVQHEDLPCKAHLLSDGTLRFLCLATLLLQPEELRPATILLDEPELGLHPYALNLLASLLRSAAQFGQLVVSTQSADLLGEFEAKDVLVVDRMQEGTVFRRLDQESLQAWLEDYSLGELWKKNLFGGGPLS